MSRLKAIYDQLKTRRVIRTGVVYLAVFWGAVEVADLLAGAEMINEDLVRWLLLGGMLGFPVVLILSWFYESPWRKRRWFSVMGDVAVILAIGVASFLLVREQFFTSFTRPVIAIVRIEPTDTRTDTAELAHHLSKRFRMLLAASAEIRIIELASSQSEALSGLPVSEKAAALGADLVIGGTVNQGQGDVRLNIQLFAADGELLWSDQFNDRLIDQAQLQNRVLDEIWPHLPMSPQAREALRELIVQCEYPTDPDAIRAISRADVSLGKEAQEQIKVLTTMIDQNRDNGLLIIARARVYFTALDAAPATSKPVFQNMAMRDLDQAAIQCPGHPDIETLRLSHTLQLRVLQETRAELLTRFPNQSNLHLQLAASYKESGDSETAIGLTAEAINLNPLDEDTVCFYRQLLESRGEANEALQRQPVENGMGVVSRSPQFDCP